MRISDWSSDVCSSDLLAARAGRELNAYRKAVVAEAHRQADRRGPSEIVDPAIAGIVDERVALVGPGDVGAEDADARDLCADRRRQPDVAPVYSVMIGANLRLRRRPGRDEAVAADRSARRALGHPAVLENLHTDAPSNLLRHHDQGSVDNVRPT